MIADTLEKTESPCASEEIVFGAEPEVLERELVGLMADLAELGQEHTGAILEIRRRLSRIEKMMDLPAL